MSLLNAEFLAKFAEVEKNAETMRRQFEEAMKQQAAGVFSQLENMLKTVAPFLTESQRSGLVQLMGVKQLRAAPEKATPSSKAGGTIEPKYQLPDGDTWAGRGQPKKSFTDWAASREGKAWRKANPGQLFPAYGNAGKASTAPASKASSGKKVAKKGARKAPAKKARKKAS